MKKRNKLEVTNESIVTDAVLVDTLDVKDFTSPDDITDDELEYITKAVKEQSPDASEEQVSKLVEDVKVRMRLMRNESTISESTLLAHTALVSRLAKPGQEILATLTPEKVDLWHMSTGMVGEAGECSEAVKKYVAYNKPLDKLNVIEELGDLEFYMQGIRLNLGITREQTLLANIKKLNKRYEQGYSDKAAQERVDKAQEHHAV